MPEEFFMDYKDTINLPKTSFKMKANLPQREPDILKFWEKIDIYKLIRESRKGKPKFILHDGPPYANGAIHIGHALNKVLKDIVVKYKTMQGRDAPYIPGWDCHGMPIEHKVMESLGEKAKSLSRLEIRKRCREYAAKYVRTQKKQFKRLGVFGDWENPYITMDKDYEANIVENFGVLVKKGYIYRGLRPIHWCPHCQTVLAEAEVEYKEHSSPSIYVKFPVTENISRYPTSFIIWTTTPWTLPANVAVAVHPAEKYLFILTKDEVYIIAEKLLENVRVKLNIKNYKVIKKVSGKELEGMHLSHPLIKRESVVICADYVDMNTGTGCVHIAPGHGYEDYRAGLKYNLPIICPVDEGGIFTEEGGDFNGEFVFDANKHIIDVLKDKGLLLLKEDFTHSYPHCWRCGNPLIFRATKQWFIKVDHNDLRERVLNEIDETKWVPSWCGDRIRNMVQVRPDWCLSRQRAWGIPIPALYCKNCGEPILDSTVIERAVNIMREKGSDLWFKAPVSDFIPEGKRCSKCGGNEFVRETDILDVWFDSSCSYRILKELPADLYLEAAEQGGKWFQLSMFTSTITDGISPFRSVLSHGLVLDSSMRKMSKNLGNVISPEEVWKRYGSDILRLQFASTNYTADFPFGNELFEPTVDIYRRIRNTFKFLLGNLYDFDPKKDFVPYRKLLEIDRLILHKLQELIQDVEGEYERFAFHKVSYIFHNFCAVDLSKFYFDILKDRLYTYNAKGDDRRSAQTVLYELLNSLIRLIAPILPYTAEEVWQNYYKEGSIHLQYMPVVNKNYIDEKLSERWSTILSVRDKVLLPLEKARREKKIGNSLEAKLLIFAEDRDVLELLKSYEKDLPSIFIVSQVEVLNSKYSFGKNAQKQDGIMIEVVNAEGKKCERCWIYSKSVGKSKEYPTLCEKCVKVMKNQ
jgi:isoleucyl-tRNA synthetase